MSKEPELTIMKILYNLFDNGMQYIGYVIIALTGGFVNHLSKLRSGEIKRFRFLTLLIDLATSGFAGLLVALLANYFKLEGELVYFLAGISGHLGARAIFLMQIYVEKRIDKT